MMKFDQTVDFGNMFMHTFIFPELCSKPARSIDELVMPHGSIQNTLYDAIAMNDTKSINETKRYLSRHLKEVASLSEDSITSIQFHAITFSMVCLNCALAGGVIRKVAFAFHFSLARMVGQINEESIIENAIVKMPELYAKLVVIFGIPNHLPSIVRNAMAVATGNVDKRITVESLCRKLFVSKGTLTKAFKNELGVAASQYISKLKLEVSKMLLSTSNTSVESIANFLAFSSINHFSFFFKKNVGITASEYRKANSAVFQHLTD